MLVNRKSFVSLLFVALAVSACSQAPKPELTEPVATLSPQFGTGGDDAGEAVFVSSRTNTVYAVGGTTRSISDTENRVNTDAFLRRHNPDGSLAWQKTFNATTYEGITDLTEDAQGSIVVSLAKDSGDSEGNSELFKYTSAGRELWRRPLAGVRVAYGVDMTPAGDFFVVGDDRSNRNLIKKYDRNGTLKWTKYFSENELLGHSATDGTGNLYVVNFRSTIYKFDPAGTLLWTRTIPAGTADEVSISDIEVSRNALLLLGTKEWTLKDTEFEYETETDVAVFSYNLSGTQNWQRTFGTKNGDLGGSIAADNEHNLYVSAYLSSNTSPTGMSFVVRKYTLAGQLLKQTTTAKNLDQPNDEVRDMTVYRNNEIYLTGRTSHNLGAGYAGGFTDAFLMRVDGQGNQVWVR